MSKFGYVLLFSSLLASCLQAGTIQDIQSGLIPEGSYVLIEDAVVTSVMHSSFTIAELPGGPGLGLWVLDTAAPTVSVGDVVELYGTYLEHNDRATLSLLHPAGAYVSVTGTTTPPQVFATVDELIADLDAWEGVAVEVTDGLIVQEILGEGDWLVSSFESGTELVLNDYFGLFPNVQLGECYNNAFGIFFELDGHHVLKTLDVEYVDCTVDAATSSFGALKASYR